MGESRRGFVPGTACRAPTEKTKKTARLHGKFLQDADPVRVEII
jgi:hypothetical protein